MKEKTKKIILIVVTLLSLVAVVFTVYYARKNITPNNQIKENMELRTMPENNNQDRAFTDNKNNAPPQNNEMMPEPNMNENMAYGKEQFSLKLTFPYIALLAVLILIFSLSMLFLIMNKKRRDFYKNKDKLTIYIMSSIILTIMLTTLVTILTNTYILNSNKAIETSEKETVVLDKSNIVSEGSIDLNNQKTDVTITKGGTYTFSGTFTNSIIVDALNEEVNIILNNVTITNEKTSAIIGLNASKITITLEKDTKNSLSDGGSSEYDGCIYSSTPLEFTGAGTLIVNGNQEEGEGIATETNNITFNGGIYYITSNDDGINAGGDGGTITFNDGTFYINASGDGIDSNKNAIINGGTIFVIGSDVGGDSGIDTDEGYTINGGTVVALGSDMIELPEDSSTQKVFAVTLDSAITKDTLVSLANDKEEIISFIAPKSFKTIIISTNSLEETSYSLYKEEASKENIEYGINRDNTAKEEIITINNNTTFTITKTINYFGNK